MISLPIPPACAGYDRYSLGFGRICSSLAGRWLDEKIDLARVYAEIWKDAAPAHLVDIAVFCESDDTHTASISYFDYVRLERR